jgi:hypothetical protein
MTIIPSSVGCRPGRLRPQPLSRDGDSFYGRTDQDEIDTRNEISQELASSPLKKVSGTFKACEKPEIYATRKVPDTFFNGLLRSQFLDSCRQRNPPLPLKRSNPVASCIRNQ